MAFLLFSNKPYMHGQYPYSNSNCKKTHKLLMLYMEITVTKGYFYDKKEFSNILQALHTCHKKNFLLDSNLEIAKG